MPFLFANIYIMNKGLFIVLEGPDRSGKSTQAALLKAWLEKMGMEVVLTREPGGTAVSEKIRNILLDPEMKMASLAELFLFSASRCQLTQEIIKPALAAGKAVISDRFTMSTEAYQGYGRGLPLEEIRQINAIATDGIKPDITIVFEVSEKEFEKRIREQERICPDRFEREDIEFRRRIRQAFSELADRPGTVKIDSSKTIEEIHRQIKDIICGIKPMPH